MSNKIDRTKRALDTLDPYCLYSNTFHRECKNIVYPVTNVSDSGFDRIYKKGTEVGRKEVGRKEA